jgi:hypothetical protein
MFMEARMNKVGGFSSSVSDFPPKDGMSVQVDYSSLERGEEDSLLDQTLQDHFVPEAG